MYKFTDLYLSSHLSSFLLLNLYSSTSYSPAFLFVLFMWVFTFACGAFVWMCASENMLLYFSRGDFCRSIRVFWGQCPWLNSPFQLLLSPPLLHASSYLLPSPSPETFLLLQFHLSLLFVLWCYPGFNVWFKQRAEVRLEQKEEMEWERKGSGKERERWSVGTEGRSKGRAEPLGVQMPALHMCQQVNIRKWLFLQYCSFFVTTNQTFAFIVYISLLEN